ncbi:MAG: hypothetical protein ABIM88_08765 [candidate division WOR-3 bacterium]
MPEAIVRSNLSYQMIGLRLRGFHDFRSSGSSNTQPATPLLREHPSALAICWPDERDNGKPGKASPSLTLMRVWEQEPSI